MLARMTAAINEQNSEKEQGSQTSKTFCYERMLQFKVRGIKQDMEEE